MHVTGQARKKNYVAIMYHHPPISSSFCMQLYSAYRRVNDYLKTTAGATNATMICDLEMMLPPALGPGMRMHNGKASVDTGRVYRSDFEFRLGTKADDAHVLIMHVSMRDPWADVSEAAEIITEQLSPACEQGYADMITDGGFGAGEFKVPGVRDRHRWGKCLKHSSLCWPAGD